MSNRDEMLARIRKNSPAPTALPEVPAFDTAAVSLLERFKAGVARMGGKLVDAPADGDVAGLIGHLFPDVMVLCSATDEVVGNRALDPLRPPAELDDVEVGVVRAVFGVAETGSVWITDAQFDASYGVFMTGP